MGMCIIWKSILAIREEAWAQSTLSFSLSIFFYMQQKQRSKASSLLLQTFSCFPVQVSTFNDSIFSIFTLLKPINVLLKLSLYLFVQKSIQVWNLYVMQTINMVKMGQEFQLFGHWLPQVSAHCSYFEMHVKLMSTLLLMSCFFLDCIKWFSPILVV